MARHGSSSHVDLVSLPRRFRRPSRDATSECGIHPIEYRASLSNAHATNNIEPSFELAAAERASPESTIATIRSDEVITLLVDTPCVAAAGAMASACAMPAAVVINLHSAGE